MRDRNKIKSLLESRLTSPVWERLKHSLLGRELISYGTEVISSMEQVGDELVKSFNYQEADMKGLVNIASLHDIAFSIDEPSTVRIMLSKTIPAKTFKPFELTLKSGSAEFTNIDYCKSGDSVILYQGVVKSMFKTVGDTTDMYFGLFHSNLESYNESSLYKSDSETEFISRLGKSLPDSIRVYRRYFEDGVESVEPVSRFNCLNYGPDIISHKIKTLEDGTNAILWGDDVWGSGQLNTNNVQIIWLEPTFEQFSIPQKLTNRNGEEVGFELQSSTLGVKDSITFVRSQIRKQILQTNVISTKTQIKDYVNSFPFVLDSSVVVNNINNNVSIYVKPKDVNDSGNFKLIELDLEVYGDMFTNYLVNPGIPVEFSVILYNVPENQRSFIVNIIEEALSYQNINFDTVVDATTIFALIQSKAKTNCYVRLLITQDINQKLKFYPVPGTVKCLNSSDVVVAWDSNETLMGRSNEEIKLGTFDAIEGSYSSLSLDAVAIGDSIVLSRIYEKSEGGLISNYLEKQSDKLLLFNTDSKLIRDISSNFLTTVSDTGLSHVLLQNVYFTICGDFVILYKNIGRESASGIVRVIPKECFWNYPSENTTPFTDVLSGSISSNSELDLILKNKFEFNRVIDGTKLIDKKSLITTDSSRIYVLDQEFNIKYYSAIISNEVKTITEYFAINISSYLIGKTPVYMYIEDGNIYILSSDATLTVVHNVSNFGTFTNFPEVKVYENTDNINNIQQVIKGKSGIAFTTLETNEIDDSETEATKVIKVQVPLQIMCTSELRLSSDTYRFHELKSVQIEEGQEVIIEKLRNDPKTLVQDVRLLSIDNNLLLAVYSRILISTPSVSYFKYDINKDIIELLDNTFYNVKSVGYVDYSNAEVRTNQQDITKIQFESVSAKSIENENYFKYKELIWK